MNFDCRKNVRLKRSTLDAQRGATLLVALMLLLGLTVVGIASMRETVVQQKAVNMALEDDSSFQAAEFALRAGEAMVMNRTRNGQSFKKGEGGSITIFDGDELPFEWWKNREDSIWASRVDVTSYRRLDDANQQRLPSYVIEVFVATGKDRNVKSDDNKVANYRITARGFGVNDAYYTVLQSTVGVQ